MKRMLVVLLVAGLLFSVAIAARASIPDTSTGRIHGCYKTSNPGKGAVVVIDSEAGGTCSAGTTALNWTGTVPINLWGGGNPSDFAVLMDGSTQTADFRITNQSDEIAISYTVAASVDSGLSQPVVDAALHYSAVPIEDNVCPPPGHTSGCGNSVTGFHFVFTGTAGRYFVVRIFTAMNAFAP